MSWTEANGVFTHAGTARTVWRARDPQPSASVIRVGLVNRTHKVFVVLFSTFDMGTCFEVGVDGANIVTRTLTNGVAGSDTTTAHGISAGEPMFLEVRVEDGKIYAETKASGFATVPMAAVAIPTALKNYSTWGLSSTVDGAVVTLLEIAERRAIIGEAADVAVAACGGDVWASMTDSAFQRIGVGSFGSDTQPSFAEFGGILYGLDGTKAVQIDAVNRTVTPWGPPGGGDWVDATHGFLPGSVDLTGSHQKGTTGGTVLCNYVRRMAIGIGHALHFSAIGEDAPHNWKLGSNQEISEDGGAFVQLFRDPILSVHVTPRNALIVGCTRSIWVITGDPINNDYQCAPLSLTIGVSGPNAAFIGLGTPIVMHSPEGVHLVDIEGTPIPLSATALTEEINYDYRDRQTVFTTVVRDPSRYGMHVFLTPRSGSRRHFFYDERTGQYSPSDGGWFPDTFPSGMQPTCAFVWKGRLIMGCRDGFLRAFQDGLRADDGAPIDDFVYGETLNDGGIGFDQIMDWLELELPAGSDAPLVRVWGGHTAEAVHDPAQRRLLWQNYMSNERRLVGKRAQVMAVELRSYEPGRRWSAEGLESSLRAAGRLHHGAQADVATPEAGCGTDESPVILDDIPPPTPPPGGGGGDEGGVDPECTGEACSHGESSLAWLAIPYSVRGETPPTLSCCCGVNTTFQISLSRSISRSESQVGSIVESAFGEGPAGLLQLPATAVIDGVTVSGYTIDVTIACGMELAFEDSEDKRGFVDFVLGAGGAVDDDFDNIEILDVIVEPIEASCDYLRLNWVVDYRFIDTGNMGKAAGVITIRALNREEGCT